MRNVRGLFDDVVTPVRQYVLETFKKTGALPFVTIELLPHVYDDLVGEMKDRGFYRPPLGQTSDPHSLILHEGVMIKRGER